MKLGAPGGGATTKNESVLGDGSRSRPPLAVPPLSLTWNVKLAMGPNSPLGGMKVS